MKRLYLIRHAEAEFTGRGRGDRGRRLTEDGRAQATRLGGLLADTGIELILASTADRAQETAHGLGLAAPIESLDSLYDSSTVTLTRALADLDATGIRIAALVAHAPGVPALVDELTGPGSDAEAVALLSTHFPTATVARIDLEGSWTDLAGARLTWADRG
ncbi:MAG TPA: histidine phosphatase family protein [Propioniciclava sp.]|jgi:phosphohistidine phosphatase|uniref:SixA phosphatase family protein n=1 Tax=Propioniciclava sp. TaxID=2038686 RepID=UPI002C5438A7|nr:histidine phosphatase family protein [Propioniciclava sp.]HRL48537.1 histidine phosphatase family protein [Propioniciclava sp.]HRL79067.1 histidine phosphatase family protein [Propioniciclava sp.]